MGNPFSHSFFKKISRGKVVVLKTWGYGGLGDSGIGSRLGSGRRESSSWRGVATGPPLAPGGALDGKGVCWKVKFVSRVLGTLWPTAL